MNNQRFSYSRPDTTKNEQGQDSTQVQKITLKEGFEQFKYASEVEGKAEKTLEQYNYVLGKFIDFLEEGFRLESITPSIVREFLQSLKNKGLSKATVAIHYRVLRAYFNWLVGEGLLDSAPTDNINEPKTPKKYPRVLKSKQVDKLIEAAKESKDTWAGFRNYTITLCFLDMGLRLNELIKAKMKNLDFSERTLKVHGKGSKERMVFFGFETYKALRNWTDMREKKNESLDNTIFVSQSGEKLKPRYVEHIISDLQEEAGLNNVKVSPHVLRHTAATLAVENGMETFALKRFFGWESIRTAEKYVHMDGSSVKESFADSSPVDNLGSDEKNIQ